MIYNPINPFHATMCSWPRGHKIRSYDRRLGAAAESADFGVVEIKLGGYFKHFLFLTLPGEMIQFD